MPKRLLAAALCLVAASCGSGGGQQIAATTTFNVVAIPPAERKAAPGVSGPSLTDGPDVSVEYAGVVTVVNFWGSWCGPCRREQPALERLAKEYGPRGVRFVGVNTRRDQRAAARAYLEEFAVTYPSIYDPSSTIAYRFGVRFMPVTYVVDRQARTAAILVGALRNEADLRTILDAELGAS